MKKFHNILFVSQGLTDETSALKQALSIARNSGAELKVLIISPELPEEMIPYKEKYEASLIAQVKSSVESARDAIKPVDGGVQVDIELENANPFVARYGDMDILIEVDRGGTPAVRIIRHVLQNAHDLVIKEAEPKEGGKGFKAVDMELLRKCPCPVWLSRPIGNHRNDIKVGVAVDPEAITPEGYSLSLQLLKLARYYADTCSGELHILSCWDYEFDGYLRDNPWMKIKGAEVDRMVADACSLSRGALDNLIKQAGISEKMHIHHIRGSADEAIPKYVEENKIDVLIMGTVGRVGIPGFIIGNTAENIVQKLGCSLLALKPNGFVSPVKAF
jgi:universal stress protein E